MYLRGAFAVWLLAPLHVYNILGKPGATIVGVCLRGLVVPSGTWYEDQLMKASKLGKGVERVWQGWKRFARKAADLQARFLLGIFYFLIFGPFALAIRLGWDPLG